MASSSAAADEALKAFSASKYPEAIDLYSRALVLNPEVPDYYLKRSIAYQRSAKYELALSDAEVALVLLYRRGKREGMGSAQIRRGIALQLLERYGDAGFCFNEAEKKCTEKDKNILGIWQKRVDIALEKLDEDDIRREVIVMEIPDVTIPQQIQTTSRDEDLKNVSKSEFCKKESPKAPSEKVDGVTPTNKIRHEWYQTPSHVVLTLFVKGAPRQKTSIEITSKSVSIRFPLPTRNDFVFDIDPLFDAVDEARSTFSVLATKIEIKLFKLNPGKKWTALECLTHEVSTSKGVENLAATMMIPLYPTSSKSGPKDWDKVAAALTSKKKKKDDGSEDDAENGSDYEGGDPVNHFFKKLYKDADEDTRRAMMKSYVESNGTALSTNWNEVGSAKVETSPPEGMEAKSWGT